MTHWIIIGILVVVIILLIIRVWNDSNWLKFYGERWSYFEFRYYKLYKIWFEGLSSEEQEMIRNHSKNKDKEGYEILNELKND